MAAYPLLLALGALDATGYSIIVPVAPAISEQTGAGPAAIGMLVASFPAGMVAGFAVAGAVVRRHGSRILLVFSIAVVALGALGFVLADTLAAYCVARALMGLGSGGIWIGVTFDTLERWPGEEYECMSRVFAAYSVGGIDGPFLAYVVMLALALPLVLLAEQPATRRAFATDRRALRTRGFWVASAAILFASVALGVLEGVLPLHLAERLGQAQIGALYVGASLVVAVSGAAAGGRRPQPLVLAALVLAVAGISLAGLAGGVQLWVPALAVAAVGIGLANTGSLGLLIGAVPVERIVSAMVVWSQVGIVGYLLGPLAGGVIAEQFGYAFIGLVPAAAAAAVLLLGPLSFRAPAPVVLDDDAPQVLCP